MVALAACPAAARATNASDATIKQALDAAMTLDPQAALARLAGVSDEGASPGIRLDLAAARAGLTIDRQLANPALQPAERFEWQMRRITGDTVQLAEIRRDLEARRAMLAAQADAAFDALGVPAGTTGARFEWLWRDPRFLYPDEAAGRDAAVVGMRATLAAIRPKLPGLFGTLPPACLDVDVRALDAAGKGGYRILPAPRARGAYVVDLQRIARRPRFSLPSVVAHELLPGHMIQMPLEARAAPHPLRKRYTAPFAEGWATYAEMLMADCGLFASAADRLGHIHWMLFRTCRGLADLALHVDGRAPDAVLGDLAQWQGEPAYFASFGNDLATIARTPAVRAAEGWVPLRIEQEARRPGQRRRVHHKLLDHGPIRL
ncbi:DUF885 domain-containing protein [Sphingomonas sp. MMSM20]|uniref:DUF885 domain-containing protein n=1 Tax=Sphingomonas lycopersici TaxID=2951807 RepID=UPI00223700E4|nr:DUF885 domain-containing protein [Sphingomonas lycopersici]